MLVISDLHWRVDTPAWRKEPQYRDVLRYKLGKLFAFGEAVVVAGDVFHEATDLPAIFDLLTFLIERDAVLYAVRGQHDQIYHNDSMQSTGFNLLRSVGRLKVIGGESSVIDGISVRGMGWGEEIPSEGAQVLIAHVPVSYEGAVYKGATSAQSFRNKTRNFECVFTGDNHKRFSLASGLYNAGCFHRMSIDLKDQMPAAWHVKRCDGRIVVELYEVSCPAPLINEAYMQMQAGTADKRVAAGAEFVQALADAKNVGGGDVFLTALRVAASRSEGAVKELLDALVKLCEEVHT